MQGVAAFFFFPSHFLFYFVNQSLSLSGLTRRRFPPQRFSGQAVVTGVLSLSPPRPYIDWVGVGWQRRCKTCSSLLELDNQGTAFFVRLFVCFVCFFGDRSQLVVELDRLCGGSNLYYAQVGIIVSCSVYGKAPKRRLHSTPIAASASAYTGN